LFGFQTTESWRESDALDATGKCTAVPPNSVQEPVLTAKLRKTWYFSWRLNHNCAGMDKPMPRDPVCGVILDKKTSRLKISHEGEKYYFCSVKCKKKFKRNRRKFVSQTGAHI